MPRQRRVPSRLGGGEAQPVYRNVEHFYQVTSFYPLLDVIINQLNLLKEKEKEQSGVIAQGEEEKGYKILCKRRNLMAEDIGIQTVLPEICKLMKIFWTIPITSCSAERSFSCLRRLKSYLHSTMGQERLTALALLDIEKDIMPDTDKIFDTFAKQSPRKSQLCYF